MAKSQRCDIRMRKEDRFFVQYFCIKSAKQKRSSQIFLLPKYKGTSTTRKDNVLKMDESQNHFDELAITRDE